jgi:hypothetical protein
VIKLINLLALLVPFILTVWLVHLIKPWSRFQGVLAALSIASFAELAALSIVSMMVSSLLSRWSVAAFEFMI